MRPGMKLFVSIIFFTVSLIGTAGLYFASQGYGGRSTMNRPAEIIQRDIPGIDSKTPSTVKTATFALG
jgi:phage gpG-like protein